MKKLKLKAVIKNLNLVKKPEVSKNLFNFLNDDSEEPEKITEKKTETKKAKPNNKLQFLFDDDE